MLERPVDRLRDVGVVGVDPGEQVALRQPQTLVDRLGLPAVRLGDPGQVRVLAPLEQLDGAVVGGAVDDDVLVRGPQRRDAVERVRQEARHVARGGDHREHRHPAGESRAFRATAYIGAPVADSNDAHPTVPRVEGTSKRALITGISGQDGSYLAELLLEKGYEVHGIVRRSSSFNTDRIDHLYHDPHEQGVRLFTHYGDLSDSVALVKLLYELQPDEIYHLGAQSHVRVSFDIPEYTFDITGAGTVRLLEAIREAGVEPALLPGLLVRDVRRGAAAAERGDAVPPAQPLRRRQGRRLLGDRQLPRGLRHVRRQRHPLQPRVPAPGRDLRHPQDHPGRRPDRRRPPGEALPRQPRRPARLGLRARLRRGDVA